MPKPTTAGPKFLLDATMPKAHLVLAELASNMGRAGAPEYVVATVERVAEKMRAYDGTTGEAPNWLIVCDKFGRDVLAHYASNLTLGTYGTNPADHADLIAKLNQVARAMKQSLSDGKGRAIVAAPVEAIARPIPSKMLPPDVAVSVTVTIGDASYQVRFPQDADDAEYAKRLLGELVHSASLLRTTPAESERWITGTDGSSQFVRGENPHAQSCLSDIIRVVSKLRAIGALNDGGEIDKRDKPEYRAFIR